MIIDTLFDLILVKSSPLKCGDFLHICMVLGAKKYLSSIAYRVKTDTRLHISIILECQFFCKLTHFVSLA